MFYRFLLIFLFVPAVFSTTVSASYAPQTLMEQVKSADQVAHVQIVSGEIHQFTHEYTERQNPQNKHIVYEQCGFSYTARVVEAFKGIEEKDSYIQFTSIESFRMGSYQLLFLSNKSSALLTDVITSSSSEEYNKKLRNCKKDLPKLYSAHLSTGEFTEANGWVSVNGLSDLPESMFVSPYISIKPSSDIDGIWNSVPSILKSYGFYARWGEFRSYLKQNMQALESQ